MDGYLQSWQLFLLLIATPYALLRDMVILISAFVLWAINSYTRNIVNNLPWRIISNAVGSADENRLGILADYRFIHC
jgi:hypothetical protein